MSAISRPITGAVIAITGGIGSSAAPAAVAD
jgi:hypothetical protein